MLLVQNQKSAFASNTLLYVMYGGLSIFFLWKIFKGLQSKKKLSGETYKFNKNISNLMIGLGLLVLIFSIFSIYQGEYLTGALMIILITVLAIEYSLPNLFSENGFIAESKFISWNDVRKWAFNIERGELVVNYKQGFEEKIVYIRLKKEDINKVDSLFRKYKLKK